jgi:hypothetical protein
MAPMIRQLFGSRSTEAFQARSPERDAAKDNEAVRSIAAAIDQVLERAEAERSGLKNRIDTVLAQAAIVGGNDIDDYLTRTEDRAKMLRDSLSTRPRAISSRTSLIASHTAPGVTAECVMSRTARHRAPRASLSTIHESCAANRLF